MVVRILGDGCWSFTTTTNKLAALAGATLNSGSSTTQFRIISGLHPAKNDTSTNLDARASTAVSGNIPTSFTVTLSGSGVPAIVKSLSINPQRTDYITKVLGTSPDATKISNTNYSNGFYSYIDFQNYSENLALSVGEVTVVTGSTVISQSMGTANVSMNSVYLTGQTPLITGSLPTSLANWNLLSSAEQSRVTSLHGYFGGGSASNLLFEITVPTASLLSLPNFSPSLLTTTNLQYVNLFPDKQD
jgi:hypothetical protein